MASDRIEDLVPGLRTRTVPWTEDVTRAIVHLLVTRREFLQAHGDYVRPDFFREQIHGVLIEFAKEYLAKHGILPSRMIVIEEIGAQYQKVSSSDWAVAESEIYQVFEYDEPLADIDHLESMLRKFYKRETVKLTLSESMELVMGRDANSDDEDAVFDKINEDIRQATTFSILQNVIHDFFDEYTQRLADMEANVDSALRRFSLGIPSVDHALEGGIGPGEVAIFLGDSGTGKSQILTHVSAQNVMQGRNVYFISVENLEDVVVRRHMAAFSEVAINSIRRETGSVRAKLDHLYATCNQRLKYACYPMGSVGISEMRADLDKLIMKTGWIPDKIVLDYVDEVKFSNPNYNTYEGQGVVVRDFRQWLQEIRAGGSTATQAGRGSNDVSVVTRKEMGDSYWKVRRADAILTLNCDKDEHARDVMRVYWDKLRNAPDKKYSYLRKDFRRCFFNEITEEAYQSIMAKQAA